MKKMEMGDIDRSFKDDTPLNTVERIKEILKSYGIQTEETWMDSGVPCCYSLRVSVYGTVFGTNGKGVTKDLALASGYGELMERLQLGRIFKSDQQKEGGLYSQFNNDLVKSVDEILCEKPQWCNALIKKVKDETGLAISDRDMLKQYADENGEIPVTAFFSVRSKKREYLPTKLMNLVYSTNGCAAGNTLEETLVQAISEIVERRFSMRVLAEEIPVPNVDEERLRLCQTAYQIISFLREQNFKVVVKDCSLGTKFPVVCVCLIDQKTGKYHTHFGAYPNFEIALQRTLTESFQGRNLQKVASFEQFAKSQKGGTADMGNLMNQLVNGTSEKTPTFFVASAIPSQRHCGYSGVNNRELLKECISFITEQGYDVLVRDCSCLGFPTYQVIVPGFSEVFVHRLLSANNDLRYTKYAQKVLRNPTEASVEEIMGYLMNLTQITKQKLTPPSFTSQANLPTKISSSKEQYLMNATIANLNYSMGRNAEVVKYIGKMLSNDDEKDVERLICIKRYLSLIQDGYDEVTVRTILEYFHKCETVKWLYTAIADNKNLLEDYVLHCDMQCTENCVLFGACVKKQTDALAQIISTKNQAMDQSAIEKLLQDI